MAGRDLYACNTGSPATDVNWNESAALPVSSADMSHQSRIVSFRRKCWKRKKKKNTENKKRLFEIFDHMLHLLTRRSRRHCSATLIESREIEKKKKQKKTTGFVRVQRSPVPRLFFVCLSSIFFYFCAVCLSFSSICPKEVGWPKTESFLFFFQFFFVSIFNIPLLLLRFLYLFFSFFSPLAVEWHGVPRDRNIQERRTARLYVQHVCPFSDAPC